MPSLTFVATANAARRRGAAPVFVDVTSEDDLTLDPEDVARKLTPRTRAVVAVHYGGEPCAMDALAAALASGRGPAPPLVEDCAHAPGASLGGRACGSLGAIGAFSFFSNKNMTTGEGGMLTTADPEIAARAKALRSHGMTTVTWDRHRGHAFSYDVTAPGTNARMDEVRAAVGLVQLGRLPAANAARARVVRTYLQALDARGGALRGLQVPHRASRGQSAHHLFVVLLPPGTERERVMLALRERGVQTSVHYPPTHRFAAYGTGDVPRTDAIAPRLLTLPLGPAMTEDDVGFVVDALCAALAGAA
jgi:dTDP-4-amino-4,6-dideoxygalactose transaminase